MHGSLQPEIKESPGLAVDQFCDAKSIGESPQFAQSWGPLLEVDEMRRDPTLRKEPQCLASVGTLPGSKDLHLKLGTGRASHCFSR
jgi:hypothetical protein